MASDSEHFFLGIVDIFVIILPGVIAIGGRPGSSTRRGVSRSCATRTRPNGWRFSSSRSSLDTPSRASDQRSKTSSRRRLCLLPDAVGAWAKSRRRTPPGSSGVHAQSATTLDVQEHLALCTKAQTLRSLPLQLSVHPRG